MKRVLPAILIVAAVVAAPQAVRHFADREQAPGPAAVVAAAVPQAPIAAPHRDVAGAGLRVVLPDGYTPHPDHAGFRDDGRDASLLVFNLDEPYAAVAARFEPEAMTARGFAFGSRESVQIDGRPAVLVTADQTIDGQTYGKIIAVVADPERTVLLTATFPREATDELALPLESAILSAKLVDQDAPDAFADLPLRVTPASTFVLAGKTPAGLVLTRDGLWPTASPDRATYVAGLEAVRGEVHDRKTFSESRLAATQGVRDVLIYAGNYASVAGLPAYEVVATGRFLDDDAPCFIHQVLVFDGSRVYVLQGIAHMTAGERCLGQFQTMAGSFSPQTPQPAAMPHAAVPLP